MPSDELLRNVVSGQLPAWPELVAQVTPSIEAIARSHREMRSRGLAALEDDVADVRTEVLSRLARHDHENLKRYLLQLELPRPQSFDSWLYGAVDYVIREHLRKRFGRAPRAPLDAAQRAPSKRELNTHAEPLEDREFALSALRAMGITTALTMAEIVQFMEQTFDETERRAIQLFYGTDRSFAQVAEALGLPSEQEAQKLVRRLTARLRHRFAEVSDEST